MCTPSTCEGVWTSSTLAVTGEELVEQLLKRRVLGHDVVFAQVVAAGGAGVHLRSERPLEASLRRDRRREGEEVSGGPRARAAAAGKAGTHLANVVRADCGDGLEGQLLAADAHEDLFHLAQEIL